MAEQEAKRRYIELSLPNCKYQEKKLGDFVDLEDIPENFANCAVYLSKVRLPNGTAYMCIVNAGFRGNTLANVLQLSAPVEKINGSIRERLLEISSESPDNQPLKSFIRLSLLALREIDIEEYTKNMETLFGSLHGASSSFYSEAYSKRIGFQTQILRAIIGKNGKFEATARKIMNDSHGNGASWNDLKTNQLRRRFVKHFRRKMNNQQREDVMGVLLNNLRSEDPDLLNNLVLSYIASRRGFILNPEDPNPFIYYKPRSRSDYENTVWMGDNTVRIRFGEDIEANFQLGFDDNGKVTKFIKTYEVANHIIPAIGWVKKDDGSIEMLSHVSKIPQFNTIVLALFNGEYPKEQSERALKLLNPLMFLLFTIMINPELKEHFPKWRKQNGRFVDGVEIPAVALEYRELILNSKFFKKLEAVFL